MYVGTDARGEMFHEYLLLFIFVSNYKTFKQVLLLNTEISPEITCFTNHSAGAVDTIGGNTKMLRTGMKAV